MPPPRRARMLATIALSALAAGCSIAPKTFRKMKEPAPISRARSVGLAEGLPADEVIPGLIEHLGDPDPVVRMAALEELRLKTGQTLGFLPWGTDQERAESLGRWRDWWGRRQRGDGPTTVRRTAPPGGLP